MWLLSGVAGAAAESRAKRRLNVEQRHAMSAADVDRFIRHYGRKAPKGGDPNDRRYDREMERTVKRMAPARLDALMRDDEA